MGSHPINLAVRLLGNRPGVYLMEAHGHAFAVDTRLGHYSIYDVAQGLFGGHGDSPSAATTGKVRTSAASRPGKLGR